MTVEQHQISSANSAAIPLPIPLPSDSVDDTQASDLYGIFGSNGHFSAGKMNFSLLAAEFARDPSLVFAATLGHSGGR